MDDQQHLQLHHKIENQNTLIKSFKSSICIGFGVCEYEKLSKEHLSESV
jgi:hypothetical protein